MMRWLCDALPLPMGQDVGGTLCSQVLLIDIKIGLMFNFPLGGSCAIAEGV